MDSSASLLSSGKYREMLWKVNVGCETDMIEQSIVLSSERGKKSGFLLENIFNGENNQRDLRQREQRCAGEIVCHYLEHQHKGRSRTDRVRRSGVVVRVPGL